MSDNSDNNFTYAGFWWRFLAALLELIPLMVIKGILLDLIIGSILSSSMDFAIARAIYSLVIPWLYYSVMESSTWQATLGKKVCRLKVTNLTGERLSFARASIRYWAQWLSAFTCSIGYLMAAFTQKKQALHDKIAKTLVLREVD